MIFFILTGFLESDEEIVDTLSVKYEDTAEVESPEQFPSVFVVTKSLFLTLTRPLSQCCHSIK